MFLPHASQSFSQSENIYVKRRKMVSQKLRSWSWQWSDGFLGGGTCQTEGEWVLKIVRGWAESEERAGTRTPTWSLSCLEPVTCRCLRRGTVGRSPCASECRSAAEHLQMSVVLDPASSCWSPLEPGHPDWPVEKDHDTFTLPDAILALLVLTHVLLPMYYMD